MAEQTTLTVKASPPPSLPGRVAVLTPRQSTRASLDILKSILKVSSRDLREHSRAKFEASDAGQALAQAHAAPASQDAVRERVAQAKALAESDPIYRLERFYQRFVAEEYMARGMIAAAENQDRLKEIAATPRQGAGGALRLNPSLTPPDYYADVEFHLMPGGWDGSDLYNHTGGFNSYIYRGGGFAAVPIDSNLYEQRLGAARQLPKASYGKIFEMGCGGIGTLSALNTIFPEAELYACELSPRLASMAHDQAERAGLKAHIRQSDAAATGEADADYDAVFTYALHHEAPVSANLEMFREMFRILKPGGDVVLTDPPPFRAVSPFHAAVLDWDTQHREEPFFSEACLADWDQALRDVGFVDVESYALGADGYPWITRGRKPD